jgi:hypothetical protein
MKTMTEQELILALVEHRVKRFLAREKKESQSQVYARCGRGTNPQEFFTIVNRLMVEGFVTRSVSERGKPVLHFVETQQG